MLTISADLSSLSQAQREALSGFILSYPFYAKASEPKKTVVSEPDVNEEELTPEAAFGQSEATQVASNGVDKAGLPWDERIHSSSKNLTADGLWRKKRGVSDDLIARVESQLKTVMAIPAPATETITSTPISVPPPPPAPSPVLSIPVVVEDGRKAFIALIKRASEAMQAGKLTKEEAQAACEKYGVPSLQLLGNRFDLVPQVALEIESILVSR